jgi:hypothetical protein
MSTASITTRGEKLLSRKARFLIAGIGGIVPVVTIIIATDRVVLGSLISSAVTGNALDVSDARFLSIMGAALIQGPALILLGALVACLQDEHPPWKAFQLGIAGQVSSLVPSRALTFSRETTRTLGRRCYAPRLLIST